MLVKNLLIRSRSVFAIAIQYRQHHAIGFFYLILLISLQACTLKSELLDTQASKLGLSKDIIQGEGFEHVIYFQQGVANSSTLHVYLDGDGQPWIQNRLVAKDPTPQNPLVLKLMSMDQAPSLYLGRPCYHGFSTATRCDASLWTSARYSMTVVASMEKALRQFMGHSEYQEVVLIGYSGGGTLAMLLAPRIKSVTKVVTIAGNLDTDAWTSYHNYAPLKESINPARNYRTLTGIQQFHLIAKADKNIPYRLVKPFLDTQPHAKIFSWENFDHSCCWLKIWPDFLGQI